MSSGNGQTEAAQEATRRRIDTRNGAPPKLMRLAWGLFGQELREIRMEGGSGYHSVDALQQSGRSFPIRGRNSDARARNDIDVVRAESQRLDATNCIYQAMLTRVCDVVLGGDGPTAQAKTADKDWNAEVESRWAAYWQAPEVRQLDDGADYVRKLMRHYLCDGDHLVVRDDATGLAQSIVADQICGFTQPSRTGNSRIESGIELSPLGKPLKYHVAPYDVWGNLLTTKTRPIDAASATFISHRRRADQTRGEPVMESAFPMLQRINDVCDSEAAAWQLLSRIAVSVTRKEGPQQAYGRSAPDPNLSGNDQAQSLATRIQDIGMALMFHGEPGDEVKGIERNIPGGNFVESIKMFLRIMGMPLGFSLEFTLLIWSDTNYSSGRASIKQVERNCRPYRKAVERVLSDLYRWQVGRWIQDGLKPPASIDPLAHAWHFPPYPFIDPQKEAQAQREAIEAGLTTPQREALANGDDFEDLVTERAAAYDRAAELVAAHNAKHADPVLHLTLSDFVARKEMAKAPAPALPGKPLDTPPQPVENPAP